MSRSAGLKKLDLDRQHAKVPTIRGVLEGWRVDLLREVAEASEGETRERTIQKQGIMR